MSLVPRNEAEVQKRSAHLKSVYPSLFAEVPFGTQIEGKAPTVETSAFNIEVIEIYLLVSGSIAQFGLLLFAPLETL
jgi:hypothetical protein